MNDTGPTLGDGAPPPPLPPRVREPRSRRRTSRFQIGRVLGATFSTWFANLLPFTVLSVLVYSPLLAWQLWLRQHTPSWVTEDFDPVQTVLSTVMSFVLTATVVQAVFAQLRGQKMSFLQAIGAGLLRLPAVVGVALLMSLAFVLAIAPAVVLGATVDPGLGAALTLPLSIVVTVLSCGWFVAVPVVVVEAPGVLASLRRSWQMTRGLKWQIFLVVFVLGIAQGMTVLVVAGIAGVASRQDPAHFTDPTTIGLVTTAVAALFGAVQAVAEAVAYHELRVEVEGLDHAELAAIFD